MFLNKTEIKIFLTFFIIYSYFIYWVGTDEYSRFDLVQAIVDEKRLTIDSFYNNTGDRSFYQGYYYTEKEPGLAFLATPVYAAWKFIYYNFFPRDFIQTNQPSPDYLKYYVGSKNIPIVETINPGFFCRISMILVTIFTSSLFSSLTVVLVYKFTKYWSKKESHRILATFIAGFATLIFPYALVFLDHGVATFFAFFAFYLLFKMKNERKFDNRCLILAGLSSGFAVTTSIMTFIISIFCFIYLFLIKKEKIFYFILGGIVGTFPFLLYNFLIFGSPFSLGRDYMDPNIWAISSTKPITYLPNSFLFYRITFDTYKGLFFYYPILILSFLGIFYAYKEHKIESLLILSLVLTYFVANSMGWWWWGSCFGPRHLTPISPFLVLPLIFVFQKGNKALMFIVFLLFLYSAFINFVGITPLRDELEDITHVRISPEFRDKVNSFEFLANPIYDSYLPMFLNNGVRSRLFEDVTNGLVPDIRFLVPEQREFFYLFYSHIPFLSLLPIVLVCTFIWRNDIFTKNRKKIILDNRWRILSILFCSIFLVSLFIVFSLPGKLTYYKGWFPPENEERWMGSDGTILFYNKMGERTATLSFYTRSYMKERQIQSYFNNITVENFTVYPETSEIVEEVNLKTGLNALEFKSLDSCDRPNILENTEDSRCLSIAIQNISLNFLAKTSIILKQNFYSPEENISWMNQDGKILIFNSENKTQNAKIKFYLKAFYADRFVTLYLNDQPIDGFSTFKEGSTTYTPLVTLKEGENQLLLHSMENCTVVADIAKNNDFRCISIGLINISILPQEDIKNQNLSFIFNKNWYNQELSEEERWMNNNATISVFNFKNETQYTTFYFYFVPFYNKKTVHFVLNDEEKNIFEIPLESGEVYTEQLPIKLGENILRFYSEEECVEISKIEKNDDYRCVSVGLQYIKIK